MLPPALTANNAFAQKRLQKKGIYCLHTKHINLCGGIDVVAFDKVRTEHEDTYDDDDHEEDTEVEGDD